MCTHQKHLGEDLLMITICFCGEIRKIPALFDGKKCLIWSYADAFYGLNLN